MTLSEQFGYVDELNIFYIIGIDDGVMPETFWGVKDHAYLGQRNKITADDRKAIRFSTHSEVKSFIHHLYGLKWVQRRSMEFKPLKVEQGITHSRHRKKPYIETFITNLNENY